MMMSQSFAPYMTGYPTIDAVRTDLNRLFYNDVRPDQVSNLPITPVWNAFPGYHPSYVQQGYYQPVVGGYPSWQGYNWQGHNWQGNNWQSHNWQPYGAHPEMGWVDYYRQDLRYAMDPRYGVDPRYSMDPRYVVDSRYSYGMDPRYVVDSRYGQGMDPSYAMDPRYVDYRWTTPNSSAHRYSSLAPALNVAETPDAHLLVIELPGVDVRDVSLQVAGHQLILTAFRKPIWHNGSITLGYHATEGRFGTLRRVFEVPVGYPTSQIQASFVNGQLTIVLPKAGVPVGAAMPTANIAINAPIQASV